MQQTFYITDQSVINGSLTMKARAWFGKVAATPLRMTLVTLVVSAGLGLSACAPKEAAPEPVRAVRTFKVGEGVGGLVRDYAAEVKARTETRLSFRVGGKLLARPVNLGDAVRAGQVLGQLDPQDLRLGQEAAQAGVAAAQTQLDLAAADFKRYQELRAQNFISAAELERRESTLKAARAQLDQARAQASVQVNQAAYASLTAPAAGVVTAVEAEPGQVLAAGTPVLRLALDGPRDAVFNVPEDRVNEVRALLGKAGAARLTPWGAQAAVPVTIHEVAAAADPATRTFAVKADASAAGLRLGQTATISLTQAAPTGAIRLPLTALVALKGQSAVWLLDGQSMKVQQQLVQVSGADGNSVSVSAGLKAGDEVVTAGTHLLTPGQVVRRFVEPVEPGAAPAHGAASAASR